MFKCRTGCLGPGLEWKVDCLFSTLFHVCIPFPEMGCHYQKWYTYDSELALLMNLAAIGIRLLPMSHMHMTVSGGRCIVCFVGDRVVKKIPLALQGYLFHHPVTNEAYNSSGLLITRRAFSFIQSDNEP